MPSPNLRIISPALFLLVPLFLLLALYPLHRLAGPLLAQLVLTLIAAFAVLAAALGLAALPRAEATVEALFVFILESSVVYIIHSLSSYRLYVNVLVFLLSSATLFSFLSTLLPVHHTVPPTISPALLVVFSLVSFSLVSHLIFPLKRISSRGWRHHNSSQSLLNAPNNSRSLTDSPSLISFPSRSPSNVIGPSEKLIQNSEGNFDLEGTTIPANNFVTNKPYASKIAALLFTAQFLFLFFSIFNLCSLVSTPDQAWAFKTAQTVFLVISSFFSILAYSQYVHSCRYHHDRVPEQATEACDSSNCPSPLAKSVYANINSKNDATHSLSKLNSHSTYELPASQSQYSLSSTASMSFPVKITEVGRLNSNFTLDSPHGTPSSASHVNVSDTGSATVTTSSRYPQAVPLPRIHTDNESLNGAGTNQDCPIISAEEYANEIYMPMPLHISPPSLLFPDDIAPATLAADLQTYVSQRLAAYDVGSGVVATHLCKKAPTLVHQGSAWSLSSSPSSISVPIVPTLLSSSSSSLALSTMCMKPRSHKSSTSSSRQMSLGKCVPLDVLSRNMEMEMAENRSFGRQGRGVAKVAADSLIKNNRRDRQALLRVDDGMVDSRSRSISAASSMTVYEDLEWMASQLETGKEKHGGFIFGSQGHQGEGDDDKPHLEARQSNVVQSNVGRAMRGRSLSISLLSNLVLGRQKEEEVEVEKSHKSISPSSSMSFSSSSILSSFSMSLSKSPASPLGPCRNVGGSEPASPSLGSKNDENRKKGRYYWTQRKLKRQKKKTRSASDLRQGRVQYQHTELVVEGPADFMDLRDPFAPPDLGARGSVTTLNGYGGNDMYGERRGSSGRHVVGSPSPVAGPKMSEWGNLSLVAGSPASSVSTTPGQERLRDRECRRTSESAVVSKSRVKVKTRSAAQSPPPSSRIATEAITKRKEDGERGHGEQNKARKLKKAGGGHRQRASSECPLLRTPDERRLLLHGLTLSVEDDQARQEVQGRGSNNCTDTSPSPVSFCPISCPEGLDVEEALLTQRLLMRLDLASPTPSTLSLEG